MKKLHLLGIVGLCVLGVLVFATARAQSGNVWNVTFYPNTAWAPPPAYSYTTTSSYFNWGTNPPGPNMPNQNWSAVMTTNAFFNQGTYQFQVLASGEYTFRINSQTVQSTLGTGQGGKTQIFNVPMTGGNNFIEVDFRQFTGPAYLNIFWTYLQPAPIPTSGPATCAPPATSVPSLTNQYGNFTPCIQQNLHQDQCFNSSGAWDSPNLGSIQMEPKIVVWGQCTADQQSKMIIQACGPAVPVKCSKSEAGWYPE